MNSTAKITSKISSKKSAEGFTLIELMIAVSILSMLLFTGSYSYGILTERWNKELGQFSASVKQAKHLELVQRALEGIQPFVVVDKKQTPSFFFIGAESNLLSVTRAGFFSGDFPEIFRLTSIKKDNGLFDLIYQAKSTKNFLLLGTEQSIEFDHQMTLFTDLEKVTFSYFGWESMLIKNSESETLHQKKWFERFSGIDNQLLPSKFNLTLIKNGKVLTIPSYLDEDSSHWLSPYMRDNE